MSANQRTAARWLILVLCAFSARTASGASFTTLDISALYNNDGVATAGAPDDGNFDAIGTTQPATFNFADEGFPRGPMATLAGIPFVIGSIATGAKNNVVASGQELPLHPRAASALYVLAACTNGSYTGNWTFTYDSGTSATVPVRFSDWCTAPAAGEAVAVRTPFRYMVGGGKSPDAEPQLFVRRIRLDPSRRLLSIRLPDQANTHVFALTVLDGDSPEPRSLPPARRPEASGPRIVLVTSAPMGALVVPPGRVRVTARAERLPAVQARLTLRILGPGSRVLASGTSSGRVPAYALVPSITPGYYRVEARLTAGGKITSLDAGLACVPDDVPAAYSSGSLFGVNEGLDGPDGAKRAFLVRRAGIKWVRQGFSWGIAQPEPARWNVDAFAAPRRAAAGQKLNTLGLLAYWAGWSEPFAPQGYRAYAEYASRMVRRYPRVAAWEVWNEPNIFYWKGTRRQYATLLKEATAAIHAARPAALVVGMATAFIDIPFIKDVLAAGGRPDIISVHPYRGPYPDQTDVQSQYDGGKQPFTTTEGARAIESLTAGETGPRPLWFTEVGWWSGDPARGGKTEQQQANALARSYATALASGVSKVFWYCFVDAGPNPDFSEHHFGMLRTDLSPKPAYVACATAARCLDGAAFDRTLDLGKGVWAARFQRGKQAITVMWATQGKARAAFRGEGGRRCTLFAWDGHRTDLPLVQHNRSIQLDLNETPVYVVEQ